MQEKLEKFLYNKYRVGRDTDQHFCILLDRSNTVKKYVERIFDWQLFSELDG